MRIVFFAFAIVFTLVVTPAFAQQGQINGVITDSSGGVVPGVTVTATEPQTGISTDTVSGANGRYTFPSLRPAVYEIRAALAGFRTIRRTGLELSAYQNLTVNVALELGELSETISVAGNAANVDVTSATISEVVDATRIVELPLNGRDATKLTTEGSEQLRMRHYKEAVKAFEGAADVDPTHPVVWNNLGSAYLALGKQRKAQKSFEKAIDLDPNYALAHYNYGAVRDAVLDYDGAIAAYARALELDPMLMDPAVNPPVVNNQHLPAVQLVLYGQHAGSRGGKVTQVDEAATKKPKKPMPTTLPPPPPMLPTPGR